MHENSTSYDYWTFYKNGSLREIKYSSVLFNENIPNIVFEEDEKYNRVNVTNGIEIKWRTYSLEGDKIYFSEDAGFETVIGSAPLSVGLPCEFIDDDTIEITMFIFKIKLVKVNLDELEIDTELEEIRWDDINISYGSYLDEHYDWINLTRSSISYYGEHAPSEWGLVRENDILDFGEKDEWYTVHFTYLPTNTKIESIYFFN